MHFVSIAIKVLAQAVIAVFVPGGSVIIALNLYRKYRQQRSQQPVVRPPAMAVVEQESAIDPSFRPRD